MKKNAQELINIIIEAVKKTEENRTSLPEDIFLIHGMSGRKNRIFLNNIDYKNSNYLEIGTWKGSTLCSYLYEKDLNKSYSIDNYSQFEYAKEILSSNIAKYCLKNNHTHIESDCFTVDKDVHGIKDIDVYFFDGPHSYLDHYRSLTYYSEVLSNIFIFIVDDWNGIEVRNGTKQAIKDLNLKIHFFKSLPEETILDSIPHSDSFGYWNGLGVFVLEKNTN